MTPVPDQIAAEPQEALRLLRERGVAVVRPGVRGTRDPEDARDLGWALEEPRDRRDDPVRRTH